MLAELEKTQLVTAEQFYQRTPEARRGELVKGEFTPMSPAGFHHGRIAMKIGTFLSIYAMEQKTGEVYAAETGFLLSRDPDTVRAPDAAFVGMERVAQQPSQSGFFSGAPDLAVEVISPSETVESVEAKLIDYLEAGTHLVWLVYPRTQTIIVYRSLQDVVALTVADTLDGGELLPGFSVPVAKLFA